MEKKSYSGPSNVQHILITLAALVIVVAGMRASADILMPFLLALFISVVANPLVVNLRSKGVPIIGAEAAI